VLDDKHGQYREMPNTETARQLQQHSRLPDKNFSKKPKTARKRPNRFCLQARKKRNFVCDIAIPLSRKTHLKYKNITEVFFEIEITPSLTLRWSSFLIFL